MNRITFLRSVSLLIIIVLAGITPQTLTRAQTASPAASPAVSQPVQPETGPGGSQSPYPAARLTYVDGGRDARYYVWEPTTDADGATPVASDALPLILYIPGWGDTPAPTPQGETDWMSHLARNGNVVIAPVYYDPVITYVKQFLPLALEELQQPGHSPIDLDRFAIVTYSYGSAAGVEYAATAAAEGLPVPKALFLNAPCVGKFCWEIPQVAELGQLPEGLKVVVMAYDIDQVVFVDWPTRLFDQFADLPSEDRNFILMQSDDHGSPAITADHDVGWEQVDAADWYGLWKVNTALFSCAFSGADCEYALGDTDEQRFMGIWNDGTPVREMIVSTDPSAEFRLPLAPVAPNASEYATEGEPLASSGGFNSPFGMTVSPDGRLAVINSQLGTIDEFDANGELADTWGSAGAGEGEFQFLDPESVFFAIGDIAFGPDGSYYIADGYNARVQVFAPDRTFVRQFGNSGTHPLRRASGITYDALGDRVLVTDEVTGWINVFASDGTLLERWGSDGPEGRRFNFLNQIETAPDGTFYVAEPGRNFIHHLSASGEPLGVWGGQGETPITINSGWGSWHTLGGEPGRMIEPNCLALDTAGNVYVAEFVGNRVQVFAPDGMVIGIIGGDGTGSDAIRHPCGIAVGTDGTIYIGSGSFGYATMYRYIPAG